MGKREENGLKTAPFVDCTCVCESGIVYSGYGELHQHRKAGSGNHGLG